MESSKTLYHSEQARCIGFISNAYLVLTTRVTFASTIGAVYFMKQCTKEFLKTHSRKCRGASLLRQLFLTELLRLLLFIFQNFGLVK